LIRHEQRREQRPEQAMRSGGWYDRAVGISDVLAGRVQSGLAALAVRAESFLGPRTSNGPRPDETQNEAWITRLCWAFVVLGVLIRLVRYLVVYPIWHDEAFVAVNFLDRGYRDLLRPLEYAQVAPVCYLWIELAAVRLFGFSEWSLRLFAAICGLASVLVFRHLASRLLRGVALLLALAVFATAFYPIRHSAEVKPYASDLLASLVLMTLAVEWWRSPGRSRWLWALAAFAPLLLAVSYPAVLVAVAVILALAPEVLRNDRPTVRVAFVTYSLVVAASFLAIYFSFTVIQSTAILSHYREGWWRDSFPPLGEPWKIPYWLIWVHTGRTMAYPIGEQAGASTLTFVVVILGGLILWRAKQPTLFRLIAFPFLLGLAAASAGRYPYGGPPRVTQYLAPSIILLTGLGGAAVLARASTLRWAKHSLALSLAALAAIGIALIARDLIQPYRERSDLITRNFARWFWSENGREAELVCAKTDLGFRFQPQLWQIGMSAVYLCNQRMFSPPRAANREHDQASLLPANRPVRLVFFDEIPDGNSVFDGWMRHLGQTYEIGPVRDFVIAPGKPGEMWLRDRYLFIELRPRGSENPLARAAGGRVTR
jgi:hypothetical protein